MDEQAGHDVERWVQSACVLCSNGCGLDIGVAGGRIVGVRGRAGDRVNHGRLGPKGLYGWQANSAPDRLARTPSRIAARAMATTRLGSTMNQSDRRRATQPRVGSMRSVLGRMEV